MSAVLESSNFGNAMSGFSSFNPAGVIGSVISGISGIATTAMNNRAQRDINSQNLAYQREVQDYNKALQERIFQREDNAVQRRALDLEKAGLSKTLAAGSAAGTGEAINLEPLHSDYKPDYSGYSQAVMAAIDQLNQSRKTSAEAAYFDSLSKLNREEERGKRIVNDINETYGMSAAGADYSLSLGKLKELNINLSNLKLSGQLTKANIIRTLSEAGVNNATINRIDSEISHLDADTALKLVQKDLTTENVTDAKFWNETNKSNKLYYDMFGVPTSRAGSPITTYDGFNVSIPNLLGFGINKSGAVTMPGKFPSEAELASASKIMTKNGFVDWLDSDFKIDPAVINFLVNRYRWNFYDKGNEHRNSVSKD